MKTSLCVIESTYCSVIVHIDEFHDLDHTRRYDSHLLLETVSGLICLQNSKLAKYFLPQSDIDLMC